MIGPNLTVNGPSGPLPPELANLNGLRTLRPGGNVLSGSLPPELANLVVWG